MKKQTSSKKRKNKTWRNSAQYRLSIRFIGLLSAAILVLSISIVGITVLETYESTRQQTRMLSETMQKADTNSQEQWLEFLQTYTAGESSPYYIQVVLDSGEVIYSYRSKELFLYFSEFKQLFFFKEILWADDLEPYYYTTITKGNAQISILVEMEDKLDLIERIISLTISLTLFIIIIGSFVTYRFAKSFTKPLSQMNIEISQLGADEKQELLLTVPESPLEVKNVSQSFNELLEKQRESMEREKQFVTNASHELRTPLAAIRGHVNLINRRGDKHPEVIPKSVAFIDTESKRMETMVEQLLLLGRINGEKIPINFSELLQQIVEEFDVMIPQEVVMSIESHVIISGSKEHFHQIIRNLLENAAKYTEETGTITIQLKEEEGIAELEIADTGIGIPDEDKQHIFERFYRADQSRSSKVPGSGIGLAIVYELVKEYDGKIQVRNNKPQGSRFIVQFSTK